MGKRQRNSFHNRKFRRRKSWLDRVVSLIERPGWDTAGSIDLLAAERAQAALDIWDPYVTPPAPGLHKSILVAAIRIQGVMALLAKKSSPVKIDWPAAKVSSSSFVLFTKDG